MKRQPRLDLNPSSADRWTTCTASPQFILDNWDRIPASTDTVYNQAGTAAHEVGASLLQNRPVGETPVPVDAEMLTHGWNYMDYVLSLRQKGSRMLVEQKLPLWYMPTRNCIVDAAVVNPDSLHIVDYKYGEGVVVHPERSLQATIYAQTIGASMLPFPDDSFAVFVHIYQPRGRAGETGPGHVWETTWGEINYISADIQQKATTIKIHSESPKDAEVVFAPSDKACQWCPAKGFCTARQASLAEGFEVLDALTPLPKPGSSVITMDQVQRILTHKDGMVSWLNDVEAWAQDFLRSGGKIPGFKLVTSRGGNRYWTDPMKAFGLLLKDTILKRHEVIEEKTISPAAVEKLIGKNKFSIELSALIAKAPGVPVLAPESDKRESIGDAVSDFEVLPEQTQQNEKPTQ